MFVAINENYPPMYQLLKGLFTKFTDYSYILVLFTPPESTLIRSFKNLCKLFPLARKRNKIFSSTLTISHCFDLSTITFFV